MSVKNAARRTRRIFLIEALLAVAVLLGGTSVPVAQAFDRFSGGAPGTSPGRRGERAARRSIPGWQRRSLCRLLRRRIRGDELLKRSGLAPVISTEGTVCASVASAAPLMTVSCKCPFPECEYWAYYHYRTVHGLTHLSALRVTG